MLLMCLFVVPAFAQNKTGEGAENVNLDFFDSSPQTQEFIKTVETYHWGKAQEQFRGRHLVYAQRELDFILVHVPNHPKALMLMGVTAKLMKNPILARPYYEKALRLFPQYAITHAQYGHYLVDIGNIKAGIIKLEEAVKMDPQLTQAHVWLAQAYGKGGRSESARRAAERAQELRNPNAPSSSAIAVPNESE
jgi:Tfp pilus assembly protein PilF